MRRTEISLKEARETLYWLKLLQETGMVTTERVVALLQEADELVAILTQ